MRSEDARQEDLKELWNERMRRCTVLFEGSRESFLFLFEMEEIWIDSQASSKQPGLRMREANK